MSTAGAGELELIFEELLKDVDELLEDIQQAINELSDGIDRVAKWLPIPVVATMRWCWRKFRPKANQIFDEVQKFITQPGMPPPCSGWASTGTSTSARRPAGWNRRSRHMA